MVEPVSHLEPANKASWDACLPVRRLSVLGAGAWGTALAIHFSRFFDVMLWSFDPNHVKKMQQARQNDDFLPKYPFPETLQITDDWEEAMQCDVIVLATPTGAMVSMMDRFAHKAYPPLLIASKGFVEVNGQKPALAFEYIQQRVPGIEGVGVLSGPSFAQELAMGKPTALSLAFDDAQLAHALAKAFHLPPLRVYSTTDRVGVSVGGAVKNVMAIATGICDGMTLGANSRAALITRGLAEIIRFGVALGARPETFSGLAGMGDLILTTTGDLSRNRRVGLMLAEGKSLTDILHNLGHVAEGVNTANIVDKWATELGVDMPICSAVCQILNGKITPRAALEQLIQRDQKAE